MDFREARTPARPRSFAPARTSGKRRGAAPARRRSMQAALPFSPLPLVGDPGARARARPRSAAPVWPRALRALASLSPPARPFETALRRTIARRTACRQCRPRGTERGAGSVGAGRAQAPGDRGEREREARRCPGGAPSASVCDRRALSSRRAALPRSRSAFGPRGPPRRSARSPLGAARRALGTVFSPTRDGGRGERRIAGARSSRVSVCCAGFDAFTACTSH